MYSLEAKIRTEIARVHRKTGALPAVVYGKDTPSTNLSLNMSEFIKLYRIAWNNHIIELNVEKKKYNVLVHEAQRHPVTGAFLHLDFLVVNMKEEIHVQIPIVLVGTAPAVLEGGQVHQSLQNLDVKCLPANLVESFELDISPLAHTGQTLHVSDLSIDAKKFTVLSNAEEAIVSIHAVKEHKEETEVITPDAVATVKQTEKTETAE